MLLSLSSPSYYIYLRDYFQFNVKINNLANFVIMITNFVDINSGLRRYGHKDVNYIGYKYSEIYIYF